MSSILNTAWIKTILLCIQLVVILTCSSCAGSQAPMNVEGVRPSRSSLDTTSLGELPRGSLPTEGSVNETPDSLRGGGQSGQALLPLGVHKTSHGRIEARLPPCLGHLISVGVEDSGSLPITTLWQAQTADVRSSGVNSVILGEAPPSYTTSLTSTKDLLSYVRLNVRGNSVKGFGTITFAPADLPESAEIMVAGPTTMTVATFDSLGCQSSGVGQFQRSMRGRGHGSARSQG